MSRTPFIGEQDLDAVSRAGFETDAELDPPPLVARVGEPGHWRIVYVHHGRGWIHLHGRWQELVTAPGLGGRVLTRSEAAAYLDEHGEPQP